MFNVKYLKFQPSEYVLRYKKGQIIAEGTGLSFFCYTPNTSVAVLPVGSCDTPFVFELITSDYQSVTLQGNLIFRIVDFKRTASMLNYVIKFNGSYLSDDPKKLNQRMINNAMVLAKKELDKMSLKEAIQSSESIATTMLGALREVKEINQLGLEVLGLSLLSILPNKETARALEACTREQILKVADDALYERRNAAIEQERKVKENEYNTEIRVEQKKRQVLEAQLEAKQSVQEKENLILEEQLQGKKRLEKERQELVKMEADNLRISADAEAYKIESSMRALSVVDKGVIQSLSCIGMNPSKLMAMAFQGISENVQKIGQLNITPDLLSEIIKNKDIEAETK